MTIKSSTKEKALVDLKILNLRLKILFILCNSRGNIVNRHEDRGEEDTHTNT